MNIKEQERRAHLVAYFLGNHYRSLTPAGEQAFKEYSVSGEINVFIEKVHALFDLRAVLEAPDQSIKKLISSKDKKDSFINVRHSLQ